MRTRLYTTARGRVSNRGDMPRFVGLLPCAKAEDGVLVFSSISELRVAEFLTWSPDVVRIAFEPRKVQFDAHDSLPAVTCWPDFEIVFNSGEIEWVEAKHSEDILSAKEKAHLELIAAHCTREELRYRVIYRTQLEENGFIGTISLLRRYGELLFDEVRLACALSRLKDGGPKDLDGWIEFASSERVPTDLLYHLLYHRRLPLMYRPLIHPELQRCQSLSQSASPSAAVFD